MISLLLLLILLFGFLMGLKRGFVLQLMHLVGFIVAFIVAAVNYKKLAGYLAHWIPYPELNENAMWAVFNSTMPLESAFYNGIAFVLIFSDKNHPPNYCFDVRFSCTITCASPYQ